MHYEINISYLDNKEKAGKITITDSSGNSILKNSPIAIPPGIDNDQFSLRNNQLKNQHVVLDLALAKIDNSLHYKNKIEKLVSQNRQALIVNYFNDVVFVSNLTTKSAFQDNYSKSKHLRLDARSFVLHQQDFDALSDLLTSNNTFKINLNKVSFLWFPEKVLLPQTDINFEYESVQHIAELLEKKLKEEEIEKIRLEKLQAKQLNIKTLEPNITPNLFKTNHSRVNNNYDLPNNNRREQLDPFDVMFMYNNPELAPMYKPNSMLAWYMYFNDHEIKPSTINEQVENVSGFEEVQQCEFKYTPQGYCVKLYADVEKTESLGILTYNNVDKEHTLESPLQEITTLKVDHTGLITGSVQSQNASKIDFNFFKHNDSFVGNWTNTSEQGIEVNSSMKLDSDYHVSSSLNNTIDTSSRYEPPPPPKNTIEWSSSNDSYSNSSSFGM